MSAGTRRTICIAAAIAGGAFALASPLAAQVGPPINSGVGTMVMEGTLDRDIDGADALFVMTFSGARHVFHAAKGLLVHGGKGTGGDDLRGLHAGETVAVHYSIAAGENTVQEVDRLGPGGLSLMEGTVIGINRRRQEIVIRFNAHRTKTFKLTDRAARDVGHDLDAKTNGSIRITVYYTDEAGLKVAHYFRKK